MHSNFNISQCVSGSDSVMRVRYSSIRTWLFHNFHIFTEVLDKLYLIGIFHSMETPVLVFWLMVPCYLVNCCQCFGRTLCFPLHVGCEIQVTYGNVLNIFWAVKCHVIFINVKLLPSFHVVVLVYKFVLTYFICFTKRNHTLCHTDIFLPENVFKVKCL